MMMYDFFLADATISDLLKGQECGRLRKLIGVQHLLLTCHPEREAMDQLTR